MAGRIQSEIKKRHAFESVAQEVFLNLQKTADCLMAEVTEFLKPHGISPTQYNVLRILRGEIRVLHLDPRRAQLLAED